VAPLLAKPDTERIELTDAILGHRRVLHKISGAALILLSAITVLLARQ